LTIVTAPSARVAKRIAAAVWRCGTALSPGSSTVKAPIRFCVVTVAPSKAGCARMSARRSTSSIADLLRGALGERLDVAPAPVHGRVLRLRRHRRDALVAIPERMDVRALQRRDQCCVASA
jgi:hypothetical protein